MPAARTAFVRVFFDRGEGPAYLGLYTLVEVPDSPFLQTFFGSDAGNLYKPAGTSARLATFDPEDFPKKTNQNDEDWTDVQDAIAVLNESRANPEVWRRRLEARFSVSTFLRWLALNTMVGNSDTYGGLAHNYFVYGSPRHRDRLFFVPWDHDLAMNAGGPGGGGGDGGPVIGGPGGGPGAGATLDLFQDRVNASWPLIRYLMDDPVYRAAYRQNVEELLNTVFESSRLAARLQAEYARIAPYVVGPDGEQPGRTFLQSPEQFTQAVASLAAYAQTRPAAVRRPRNERAPRSHRAAVSCGSGARWCSADRAATDPAGSADVRTLSRGVRPARLARISGVAGRPGNRQAAVQHIGGAPPSSGRRRTVAAGEIRGDRRPRGSRRDAREGPLKFALPSRASGVDSSVTGEPRIRCRGQQYRSARARRPGAITCGAARSRGGVSWRCRPQL